MNLQGDLRLPSNPLGVVIFVHGSGSGRFSPRNQFVAEELNKQGFATLLLDLLTEEEHRIDMETMEYRFNIHLLASRSTLATSWVHGQPGLSRLPIGLFGASTGAAAALITAAEMKLQVAAVVSRGGRPDLAEEFLLADILRKLGSFFPLSTILSHAFFIKHGNFDFPLEI